MLCKTKRSKHHKCKKRIVISLLLIVLIVILFEIQAIPFIEKCVEKQSKTISTNIIADKVEEIQDEIGYTYSDLATIKFSQNGEVKAISENTINVNKLKSRITREIQSELDKKDSYSFNLPIGSFTDITMLSTFGPEIEISFILTGSVNCKIKSTFESGGVNQAIHHINLIVTTDIITVSPNFSEENTFTTDYEIAQTVIVGEAPSAFADIVR